MKILLKGLKNLLETSKMLNEMDFPSALFKTAFEIGVQLSKGE